MTAEEEKPSENSILFQHTLEMNENSNANHIVLKSDWTIFKISAGSKARAYRYTLIIVIYISKKVLSSDGGSFCSKLFKEETRSRCYNLIVYMDQFNEFWTPYLTLVLLTCWSSIVKTFHVSTDVWINFIVQAEINISYSFGKFLPYIQDQISKSISYSIYTEKTANGN